MAIFITDNVSIAGHVNLNVPTMPYTKVGVEWAIKDGSTITGHYTLEDGTVVNVEAKQKPISDDFYFIVPDKCTECVGFHEEPQCAAVCPVDCCVPDPDRRETEEILLARKERLHL